MVAVSNFTDVVFHKKARAYKSTKFLNCFFEIVYMVVKIFLFCLRYFDEYNVLKNVPNVFILLACTYAAMNVVGTLLLSKPKVKGEKV